MSSSSPNNNNKTSHLLGRRIWGFVVVVLLLVVLSTVNILDPAQFLGYSSAAVRHERQQQPNNHSTSHSWTSSRVPGVPLWKDGNISIQALVQRFQLSVEKQRPDEIWYAVAATALGRRARSDTQSLELRTNKSEVFFHQVVRYLQRHHYYQRTWRLRRVTPSWPALHDLLFSSSPSERPRSFPLRMLYGDTDWCDDAGDTPPIPTFPTSMQAKGCDYRWSMPNYHTIDQAWPNPSSARKKQADWRKKYGPWTQKIPKAVWRGTLNGKVVDLRRNARLQLYRLGQNATGSKYLDVQITNVAPHVLRSIGGNMTALGIPPNANLSDHRMKMTAFQKYQMVVDTDGNSWSSRFGDLLCFDTVVLKVEPIQVDYFWERLQPWVHYVPVAANLSDLMERIAWVVSHEEEAQSMIAAANVWCASNLVKTPVLMEDTLDIWNDYVKLLRAGNSNWNFQWEAALDQENSQDWEWQSVKGFGW